MKDKLKIYSCPKCFQKKFIYKKDHLICKPCDEYYPIYKNIPIMLTIKNDFYHLKKALTPAKFRVFRYNEK